MYNRTYMLLSHTYSFLVSRFSSTIQYNTHLHLAKQKKEKKERKLTVMQQEFLDWKNEQKRLRKEERKRQHEEETAMQRAIEEAERKLAEKVAREAEEERLRLIEEEKARMRLKYILHNPKEKPTHHVLDNVEKVLFIHLCAYLRAIHSYFFAHTYVPYIHTSLRILTCRVIHVYNDFMI